MGELTVKKTGRPIVFGIDNEQCVWSRAGVAKPMKCINAFDCLGCSFDRKLQAKFAAQQKIQVKTDDDAHRTRMKLLLGRLKCRHMLSGRVHYKLCAHGYNCVKCPYDQMLEDTSYLPNLKSPTCDQTSGFNVARDHYYHFGHTWARVEYGGRVRVGIDDFAFRLLGPQDEIKLPGLGETVSQGRPKAILRRGENKAETMSPVDGKVIAINHNVKRRASIANKSPYSVGWLMVIQPSSLRKNLKNLFFGIESLAWMDDEALRLNTMLGEQTGYKMAATGGRAIKDIYGEVPGLDWDRLVEEFLG